MQDTLRGPPTGVVRLRSREATAQAKTPPFVVEILLPTGEVPAIAQVADLAPLKDQLFFKNAQKGDIVLMYMQARKAILYDPGANLIIEVAPITANGKP